MNAFKDDDICMVAYFPIDGAVVAQDMIRDVGEDGITYRICDPKDSYTTALLADNGIVWASEDGKHFVMAVAVYANGKEIDRVKLLEAFNLDEHANLAREVIENVKRMETEPVEATDDES